MSSRKIFRLKLKFNARPLSSLPPPNPSKQRKTGAQATKDWKDRLKVKDPAKYEEYVQKCRNASKRYRQNCSEEQKVKQREQSRQRMQAYRARKKANEPAKPRKTRAAKEEQREKWREAKAKWWANLNPQKKRRVKEKRAQRERENRASKNVAEFRSVTDDAVQVENMPASTSRSLSNRTPEARRKAKQRVYAGLPKSPQKLVETLHDVVKTLTPRKKHLFKKLHPAESLEQKIGASVLLELKKTNTKRSKEILHSRRNLLNICQKYINRRGSSISNSILPVNRRSIESQATLMQKKTVKKCREK